MRRIRILLLLMAVATGASGYHIAGGDLTAQWISGQTFQLQLSLFRDCSNTQAAGFDNEIILGIYIRNNNQLYDSVHMTLSNVVSLGLAGNTCAPPPNVCMEKGDYIRTINLPPQPGGYYIVWERCCRNASIINIGAPDATGMTFYLEVADPALQNSSPVFNSPPLPYSCVSQLFRFHFDATDTDGDSLVYQLTNPLDGGHTWNGNPNPFSPGGNNTPPDPAPYTDVSWAQPYELTNLTDGSIPVTINSQTGLMEGSADVIGIYAMAVIVYEYRNGVLIGAVRREIEFTAIACDGNSVPQVVNTLGVIDTTIYASDTLCFYITATDPEGDSLTLIHYGELFQNDTAVSIIAPFATSQDSIGIGSVAVPFCWYSDCGQFRDSVYKVTYEATDNGCPLPGTQRTRLNIKVLPAPIAPKPNLLCMKLVSKDVLQIATAIDTTLKEKYFSNYILYRSINGGSFQAYQTVNNYNTKVFVDSSAFNNNIIDYCYTLSIVNKCGYESEHSDTLCSVSVVNTKQNYLRTVSVEGNKEVRIAWEEFSDGPFSIYHLYRRTNESGNIPVEVATLQNYFPMQYIDNYVAVNDASYCYTLINEDVCGNFSPASEELCTILLKGKSEIFQHHLQWNDFSNWKGGTDQYITERSDVVNTTSFVALTNSTTTTVEDKELPISGGVYAYRIRALEGVGSYSEESLSNEIVLQQEPLAWIPNAFSPNLDGTNDDWGVNTAYVASISLSLYNRWGQLIWQTIDKSDRWDGKYNGEEVPQGVYFYIATYKGFSKEAQLLERKGLLTVIR